MEILSVIIITIVIRVVIAVRAAWSRRRQVPTVWYDGVDRSVIDEQVRTLAQRPWYTPAA